MSSTYVHTTLLKTRSVPSDGYETACLGSELDDGARIAPEFIPVLLHRFNATGMTILTNILKHNQIGRSNSAKYGGIIFTSQRSVEAFSAGVSEVDNDSTHKSLKDVPFYSVGPATTRALQAIPQLSGIRIFGDHTGNGADLAAYMLDHYNGWYGQAQNSRPLLFLVGEQRRDVIPRLLMDPSLKDERCIPVVETVVYETTEMPSFAKDLHTSLTSALSQSARSRWIIIFSPTGCDTVLRELNLLDQSTGKAAQRERDGKTFIATIGPTTRQHLLDSYGFEPDFWAKTPSPEGIIQGIKSFESSGNSTQSI